MKPSDKAFLASISLLIVAAICAAAYHFLVQKDYAFIVEAPCDPAQDTCFVRDCSGGECPPNELEHYRMFSVQAADFDTCADNSCLHECQQGDIACTEIVCGESEEDECAQ
jgi:hypothetical protein